MAAAATASTTAAAAPVAASFEALGLDLRLLKAVRKLGLARPTAVQARCIPLVLQGKDVVARAPTGTGKTYAYSIPLLQKVLARQDGLAGAAPEEGSSCEGTEDIARWLRRLSRGGRSCTRWQSNRRVARRTARRSSAAADVPGSRRAPPRSV